jgi:hypothetical protein
MIPFVDQLCDVRDLVANCRQINDEPDETWHWVSLVLTLIGLFPSVGSLLKGCLKVLFAAARKGAAKSRASPKIELAVDASIAQLHRFLNRPEVAKAMKMLRWDNPFKVLAIQLRQTASKLNTAALKSAFDNIASAAQSVLGLVKRWGGADLARVSVQTLKMIDSVRSRADKQLGNALNPVRTYLTTLARKLEIEADMAHRAYLNSVNPHAFKAILSDIEEAKAFGRAKPDWVDVTTTAKFDRLDSPPIARPGWPDVGSFETFHKMEPVTIPPGTKLYRIVDPRSRDNSICWMSEEEFKKLKSKSEWRRRFAVWAHWNSDGEFVTYTVPPGPGLNVWEGAAASQRIKGTQYFLEGGSTQIVVDPSHLDKAYVGTRNKTGWGYDDLGIENDLIGVPVQRNNFT